MHTSDELITKAETYLAQCGNCDADLPMTCVCPAGDPRAVISQLVGALRGAEQRTRRVARLESVLHDAQEALAEAPRECRFHGTDFERSGRQHGVPRCEFCRQPWLITVASMNIAAELSAVHPTCVCCGSGWPHVPSSERCTPAVYEPAVPVYDKPVVSHPGWAKHVYGCGGGRQCKCVISELCNIHHPDATDQHALATAPYPGSESQQ